MAMRSTVRALLAGSMVAVVTIAGCGGGDGGTDPVEEYQEPPEPAWTFCTNEGAPCEFVGLRVVRLGPSAGPYVEKEAFGTIPCAPYGFDNQNPAPSQSLHCDYSPVKTDTIPNPSPGMGVLRSTVIIPVGSTGFGEARVRSTSEQPDVSGTGIGAFRTTCFLAATRFDDPIVFPGRANASHLHMFFGNAAINESSTPASLAASGNSTCRGGILNRTGYWVPAMVDSRSGKVVPPAEATFYYKTGYNMDVTTIQPFPNGLRFIAGSRDATGPQSMVEWLCRDANGESVVNPAGTVPTNCKVGDKVRVQITFPQCWDGVNVDSPDHKSHMAYPIYRSGSQKSSCPPSHPVPLPEITEHFDWVVTNATSPAYWRLTSDMYPTTTKGGLSAHADWMNGWDPETMRTIVTQCLNKGYDCGVGTIGNSTTLY